MLAAGAGAQWGWPIGLVVGGTLGLALGVLIGYDSDPVEPELTEEQLIVEARRLMARADLLAEQREAEEAAAPAVFELRGADDAGQPGRSA